MKRLKKWGRLRPHLRGQGPRDSRQSLPRAKPWDAGITKILFLERIQESNQLVSLLVSEVGESPGRVDGLAVVAKDCIGA